MKSDLTSFSRTMRVIDADGMRPTVLALVLVALLIVGWTVWLLVVRVPVYEMSRSARLEVERIHPVAAAVPGRVVSTSIVLGREVKQGEVLLEVEAENERLETAGERTKLAAITDEMHALERQSTDTGRALTQSRAAAKAALTEATLRLTSAEASAKLAQDKVNRFNKLAAEGLIPAADLEQARADQQSRSAEVAAARVGIDRLRAELEATDREKQAQINSLARDRLSLQGMMALVTSTVERRDYELDRRRIRAPVSGRLAEVNPVQVGAVIESGLHLASIVPDGNVRVVAEFEPPALGRLHPGQRARVRLDGFPWMQYGHVDARVTRVAGETREQKVRVELAVLRSADSKIPLQHGMPGAVEVEVERTPPVALLLRSVGQLVSGPRAAAPPAPGGVVEPGRR